MRQRALDALARIGSRLDPDVRVRRYRWRTSRWSRSRRRSPRQILGVLILDEPTAILSPRECDALFACIKQLTSSGPASAGLAVLYCTHRLEEVARIADTVTVLRDGRLIKPPVRWPRCPTRCDRASAWSAETLRAPRARTMRTGAVALAVSNLSSGFVRDVTFEVRATARSSVFVLLVGAGRTELRSRDSSALLQSTGRGAMSLDARPFRARRPADAIRRGFGFVPEDRKGAGLIMARARAAVNTIARAASRPSRDGPSSTAAANSR